MSLHKLTAGDGYTYLIRQVAAADAVARGYGSLGDYYSQKGEAPGLWIGAGVADIGVTGVVSEAQMLALFGEGRHPDADALERAVLAGGGTRREADTASRLGRPFYIYQDRPSEFRRLVAQRIGDWNGAKGLPRDWPVPAAEKARIRTQVATELFTKEHGRPPVDGRELAGFIARESRAQTTAVVGYDLTFSPVKSVSALWAIAPRDVAERVRAAHDAAVADVIGWLEREAAFTRTGRDGIRQVPVRGLIAASFTHRDSRAGDPDLHTHVAVSNKVHTLDGRWLALDGRILHKAAVTASERYNTRLEAHLTDSLGVRFAPVPTGGGKRPVREIVGLDPRLLTRWSSRRIAVTARQGDLAAAFQRDHGRPPTSVEAIGLAGQATLQTRQHKHAPRALADQRRTWRAEAGDVLGSEQALTRMLRRLPAGRRRPQDVTKQEVDGLAREVLTRVAADRATWQVWHVRAEAERLLRDRSAPLSGIDDAVNRIVSTALGPAHSIPLTRPEPVREPVPLRRPDGTSVYTQAGSQHYTSAAVLAAEQSLIATAHRRDGRHIDPRVVAIAVLEAAANGTELNPGQTQLVRDLATSGSRVQLAIAPAGTGKTTAMGVLARAWTDSGGHVLGLAPSAAAAGVLRDDLGVHADTLAKLTHAITTGDWPDWVTRIGPGTLVIIDEAGMAGSTPLATAVDFIVTRGGSVRLIADDRQLAAVGAGGVLRDIAHTAGAVTLSHVVRFTDPAEAAASLAIRGGDPAGIAYYLDQRRVHVGDPTTAAGQAYDAWAADRAAGQDTLLVAPTRDLVTTLNARARADRLTHAAATGPTVRLSDGLDASTGDAIITRANDRRLTLTPTDFVKNGDRWTIHTVGADGALTVVHARLGIQIVLPAGYVREHAELGYATTVHAAQGTTTDTCHTVITGQESRQILYVALSRGRAANHIYVQTTTDGDPHTAIRPDTVRPPTAGDILTRILGRDGAQQSATTTLSEADTPARMLGAATARYTDALTVAEENAVGAASLDALAREAEAIQPDLTDTPAWPALRATLTHLAATGTNPHQALRRAVARRDLADADDPAATLAHRLHARPEAPGPLPWLPAIPEILRDDPIWGRYLQARHELVADLADRVRADSPNTSTTSPSWARHLPGADQHLMATIAVWRAVTGIDENDPRPTGAPHREHRAATYQQHLDRRIGALTRPSETDLRLTETIKQLSPRITSDPYWPILAARLDTGRRAGIDTARLARTAHAAGPLPDEQPAAALWWRLSRHLSPAVLADGDAATSPLRPTWLPELVDLLGPGRAKRALGDPAWPALVAALTTAEHHGSTPSLILRTAADGITEPDPQQTLAETLLWRVAVLTDPPPPDPADGAPPQDDDTDQDGEWLPPADDQPYLTTTSDPDVTPGDPIPAAPPTIGRASTPEATDNPPDPAVIRRLVCLNQQAHTFYTEHLPGSWARYYLRDRLDTDLTDSQWEPGYAPAGWTHLIDHLREHGATDSDLLTTGLASTASTGTLIDRFRDRLVFPLHDDAGDIIGFIGRRHPDRDTAGPKYLNTPTTPLYRKSEHLYGRYENADALTAGARPVIVEGPLDALAITLASDGRYAGVAPLGTALTPHHAALLLPRTAPETPPSIYVASDPDTAGQSAAERAFTLLAARGADPQHVHLPDGHDPADLLVARGPAALRDAIQHATPLGTTMIDHTIQGWLNLADRHGQLHHWNHHGGIPTQEWQPALDAIARLIAPLHPDLWTQHLNHAVQQMAECTIPSSQLDDRRPALRAALINTIAHTETTPSDPQPSPEPPAARPRLADPTQTSHLAHQPTPTGGRLPRAHHQPNAPIPPQRPASSHRR